MGPPVLNVITRWLLELLTRMMTASEAKKAHVTMTMLAPILQVARQCALAIPILGALRAAEPAELPCLPLGIYAPARPRSRRSSVGGATGAARRDGTSAERRLSGVAGGTAAADGRAWEDHEAE